MSRADRLVNIVHDYRGGLVPDGHRDCGDPACADREVLRLLIDELDAPIPMVLTCPFCDVPHIDKNEWATKPHKTHLCEACGAEWRPCNRATVGVVHL